MSRQRFSSQFIVRVSWRSSWCTPRFPNWRRAAAAASSRDMPRAMKRSVSSCRCARTSSSISRSCCSRVSCLPKRRRNFADSVRSCAIMPFLPRSASCGRPQLLFFESHRGVSWLLSFEFEDAADHAGDAFPLGGLAYELLRAFCGDRVELCFAVVVGGAPAGGDPALLLEAEQGSVDGAFVQLEDVFADLLDAAGDAEAVLRSESVKRLEDHEVEGALEDVGFGRHGLLSFGHSKGR